MPIQPSRYQPPDADVAELMRAAGSHPLGLEYLRSGHLGTVAVTFGYHAFTVLAARERLARTPADMEPER